MAFTTIENKEIINIQGLTKNPNQDHIILTTKQKVNELLDILNEDGSLTGETISKREAHEIGALHSAVHVWIYTNDGRILLQKRASDKDSYPDCWDISAAGHISAGENPLISAVRETSEEIGLPIKDTDLKLIGTFRENVSMLMHGKPWKNNEIDYVFLLEHAGEISDFRMEDGEVQELRYITLEEFDREINDQETYKMYVPHKEYYEAIIKAVRENIVK